MYGSTKDLGEGTGAAGGFLVPTEYATESVAGCCDAESGVQPCAEGSGAW